MAHVSEEDTMGGFGSPALLDRIDELRRLNIASMVPLPQLVVVGDQSSGKSSVLEGLTGFPFPRAVDLCTRYATEIICRRDEKKSITVSIRPRDGATEERVAKLQAFKIEVPELDPKRVDFHDIFRQASNMMGLRGGVDSGDSAPAFSEDVLRVEISGPSEEHLTVIDVPGIFENPTPGLTDVGDIAMVKNMVQSYIQDSRTIILAVVPCTADIATQQIFKRAEEVDREGKRTIGVLTKPDLLREKATRDAVIDLARGNRKDLKLGYFVIRNRGADDTNSDLVERHKQERAFFNEAPWCSLDKSRVGIGALRLRLRDLLMECTKREFPTVRKETTARLHEKREQLKLIGEPRTNTGQQRVYLGNVALRFMNLARYAVEAYYTEDPIFDRRPELRLVTRMRDINDAFAIRLFSVGHSYLFQGQEKAEDTGPLAENQEAVVASCGSTSDETSLGVPDADDFPELADILTKLASDPKPACEDITSYIRQKYLTTRGQEIGNFNNLLLPIVFKEQSKVWRELILDHVSNSILIIHDFIDKIMREACPDAHVREVLWSVVVEDLLKCYRCSVSHARFLIGVERENKIITCNPEFTNLLKKNRKIRNQELVSDAAKETVTSNHQTYIQESKAMAALANMPSEIDQICADVHDALKAYYELARSRIVDEIYQQVVGHFLLNGSGSPLQVFGPERVISMTSEELKMIAEEDPLSTRERERLEREISSLEKAVRVLWT